MAVEEDQLLLCPISPIRVVTPSLDACGHRDSGPPAALRLLRIDRPASKRMSGRQRELQKDSKSRASPRDSRFGSPQKLSRVHWVKPDLVVEVIYSTWTEDNLLRQVSYQAQRADKPARQVVRPVPHQRRVLK